MVNVLSGELGCQESPWSEGIRVPRRQKQSPGAGGGRRGRKWVGEAKSIDKGNPNLQGTFWDDSQNSCLCCPSSFYCSRRWKAFSLEKGYAGCLRFCNLPDVFPGSYSFFCWQNMAVFSGHRSRSAIVPLPRVCLAFIKKNCLWMMKQQG